MCSYLFLHIAFEFSLTTLYEKLKYVLMFIYATGSMPLIHRQSMGD